MLTLRLPPFWEVRARYVLDVFFRYYPMPADHPVSLYYGDPASVTPEMLGAGGGVLIPFSPEHAALFEHKRPYAPEDITEWRGLPFLFPQQDITQPGWTVFPVDLIASAFYFLSAYEEAISDQRDPFGRFSGEWMLLSRLGREKTPVVEHYFALLAEALGLQRAPLPGGAPFVVCLSHDVEYLFLGRASNPLRQGVELAAYTLRWLRGRARFATVIKALRGFWAYPYFNLDDIKAMEADADVTSTFNFIARFGIPVEKQTPPTGIWRFLRPLLEEYVYLRLRYPVVNADYHLSDPRVKELIQRLEDGRFEVALHASFEAIPEGKLAEDVAHLRAVAPGFIGMSTHYQSFRLPELHRQAEANGLAYENSLYMPEFSGYRTGMGLPHPLFDHEHDRPFSVLAIPLPYMEAEYMNNLTPMQGVEAAWDDLKSLLDAARQRGSILSVLTHNWVFSDRESRQLYERLLAYLREHGGVGLSARAVYQWWADLGFSKMQ